MLKGALGSEQRVVVALMQIVRHHAKRRLAYDEEDANAAVHLVNSPHRLLRDKILGRLLECQLTRGGGGHLLPVPFQALVVVVVSLKEMLLPAGYHDVCVNLQKRLEGPSPALLYSRNDHLWQLPLPSSVDLLRYRRPKLRLQLWLSLIDEPGWLSLFRAGAQQLLSWAVLYPPVRCSAVVRDIGMLTRPELGKGSHPVNSHIAAA